MMKKFVTNSISRALKNKNGMTMVESLVAVGLASVSILMVVTGTQYVNKQIHTNTTKNSLNNILDNVVLRIKSAIESDYAWNKTLLENASLRCNDTGDPCATIFSGGSPVVFTLKDQLNNTLYNPGGSPDGYTLNGTPCTFNPSTPEDCPVIVSLNFFPTCPSGLPCHDSPIRVSGVIALHDSVVSNQNILERRFEILKVPPNFENQYFSLRFTAQVNTPGGSCSSGWQKRPIDSTAYKDPGGHFVSINSGAQTFSIKAGTYVCGMKTHSYGAGITKARLVADTSFNLIKNSSTMISVTSIDGNAVYSTPSTKEKVLVSKFENLKLDLPVDTTFSIEQLCSGFTSSNSLYKLGHPSAVGNAVFLTFRCKKKKF